MATGQVYNVDMQYNLPKGYLSHSAMELWRKSKDQYRLKYYSTEQYDMETVYTRFGKEIALTLEDKAAKKAHPVLSKIPSYQVAEFPLELELAGVPIKGFIDSFDPKKKRIIEYKTGIRKDGKAPWDAVRVKKHNQVLLYAALVKELFGEVSPNTKLVWLETCWKETPRGLNTFGPDLQLTGHFEVFKRKIEDWEIEWIKQEVVKIATEISDDFTKYQSYSGVDNQNLQSSRQGV